MKWLEKQAMNDVYVQKKTLTLSIQLIQNYMDLHILHIIISLKITCKKKWKAKMAWKPGDEWCMRPEEDADTIIYLTKYVIQNATINCFWTS